jgi:acyl phosphate:glycerol-3-phosphate acyltransferase
MIIAGYFIGSIPFGYIAGKMRGIDIRKEGSGNIGSTNVARVLGKRTGRIVQALDIAKGIVPILLCYLLKLDMSVIVIAGLAAIAGHNWTIFLGFKGGKGVNTSLGVALALMPVPALLCFAIWAVVVKVWKYISLGSIVASAAFPFFVFFLDWPVTYPLIAKILSVIVAFFIIIRHRSNIVRLIKGTEFRVGSKTK